MIYKQDIDIVKKRLCAFWNGDIYDRCIMLVTVPKSNQPRKEVSLEKYWTDVDYFIERNETYFENTHYFGEAVPQLFANLGPGSLAAYMGAHVELMPDTVWFSKSEDSIGRKLEFDRHSKWWRLTVDIIKKAAQRANGNYFIDLPDLGGVADIQASLRGTSNLCIDMIDNPEDVRNMEKNIMDIWKEAYLELYELGKDKDGGTCNWLELWAPGKTFALQCDFSWNISNEMFRKFYLPLIAEQCEYIDYPAYHLDGSNAVKHLDSILEISKIRTVQWQPGYARKGLTEWVELMQYIQKRKRNLVICIDPKEIDLLINNLSPVGLCIWATCQTTEEAEILIEKVTKWQKH